VQGLGVRIGHRLADTEKKDNNLLQAVQGKSVQRASSGIDGSDSVSEPFFI
jgi:hypothetical protein